MDATAKRPATAKGVMGMPSKQEMLELLENFYHEIAELLGYEEEPEADEGRTKPARRKLLERPLRGPRGHRDGT